MGLFGKKKESASCCCSASPAAQATPVSGTAPSGSVKVAILGSGCAKCNQLEANTRAALAQLGMEAQVGHVTDFAQIAAYGVMSTPALAIDGKVVSAGRVLTTAEAAELLQKAK